MELSPPASEASRDVAAIVADVRATIAELQSLGETGDVTREFQRLLSHLLASSGADKQLVDRGTQLVNAVQATKAPINESKVAIADLQANKDSISTENKHAGAELADVVARVGEQTARHDQLVESITSLQVTLALGAEWTPAQKLRQSQLQAQRSEVVAALELKRAAVVVLRRDVDMLMTTVEAGERANTETIAQTTAVQDETQAMITKTLRLTAQQSKYYAEVKSLQTELDQMHVRITDKTCAVQLGDDGIAKYEALLRKRKQEIDKMLLELSALMKKSAELTSTLEGQLALYEASAVELRKLEERTRAFAAEEALVRADADKQVALHDLAVQKLEEAHTRMEEVDDEVHHLDDLKAAARTDLDNLGSTYDALQRSLSSLQKERGVLQTSLEGLADKAMQVETIISMQKSSQKMVENELAGVLKQVKMLRQMMADVREELLGVEALKYEAEQRVMSLSEQLALQEVQSRTLKQKSQLQIAKLKKQQGMYEAVREERNAYCKSSLVIQVDIDNISLEFRGLTKTIDHQKDLITTKDHDLVRVHFDHHKVEKEKETTKAEAVRVKRQVSNCEDIMAAQAVEMQKLHMVTTHGDEERSRQVKEYQSVTAECDSLRAQVIQRDSELAKLYEKLKIQRSNLEKSANTFRVQREVERSLLVALATHKSELQMSKLQVVNVEVLKREVIRFEKEVRTEQFKSRALEQETSRPMNIHRWRQLEASNPVLYETIFSVQKLQRRLIQCSEDIVQRDKLTREKEALYRELRTALDRQPGSEVVEQLALFRQTLKQKQAQLRAMEAELEACKATVKEHKSDVEIMAAQRERYEREYLARAARQAALEG